MPGHKIVGVGWKRLVLPRERPLSAPATSRGHSLAGLVVRQLCVFCLDDRENLCPQGRYTGYQLDGGYAEYTVADASFCFGLPERYD